MPTKIFSGIRLFQGFKVIERGKYVQNAKEMFVFICKLQFYGLLSLIF